MLNSKSPLMDWMKQLEKRINKQEKIIKKLIEELIRIKIIKEKDGKNNGVSE